MKVVLYAFSISALLMEHNLNFATANCENKCEQSSGSVDETGIKQHAMLGHSFKNFTVNKPYDCHVKCFDEKCWCQAYQITGTRCELLEEDRFSSPDEFVEEDGYTYFDMKREFAIQIPGERHCNPQSCNNQCCVQRPCVNGGTCTELCDNAKQKFNCTCTAEYFGKLCQKRRATSCKEQTQRYQGSLSGVYPLFDAITSSLYDEFCDFSSENGFVWSLVESLSLANWEEFKDQAFYKDYPVNQDNFDWNRFRLSKSRMNTIATSSTHFRATCNFNLDGLNYTDYLRARFADIAIMSVRGRKCFKYEYINVRGYDCHNCTADLYQGNRFHAHVDSYIKGCEREFPDALRFPDGEDNFGAYVTVNPLHRCSSNDSSTTQWWFGEQY